MAQVMLLMGLVGMSVLMLGPWNAILAFLAGGMVSSLLRKGEEG